MAQSPAIAERIATTAVFVVNGLGIGAWAAAIPRLGAAHALSTPQLSEVLLCFALGAVVAMPAAGLIGTRHRSGPVTWASALAFSLALGLPPWAPTFALLCAAALGLGAANGAVDVLMNAHASQVERAWGRPIMSSFHASFSVGGMAGTLLGSVVARYDQAAGLWVPGLLGAAAALGAARHLTTQGQATPPAALRRPSGPMLALCLMACLCMLIEGAMADWSGEYLTRSHVPGSYVAFGYAAFSLAMVTGRLAGDRVVARFGAGTIFRVGGALAATGLALTVLKPNLSTGIAGFGLVGLGLSNVVPSVFSAAARTGTSASAGVAMAATAGYAGFLAGPVAIGALASLFDLRAGMAALACAALVIAALGARRGRAAG